MAPGKVNEVKCEGIFQDCTMYRFSIDMAACPCSAVRLQDTRCQVGPRNFNPFRLFDIKRMGRPLQPANYSRRILSLFVSHCKRKELLCRLKKPPLSLSLFSPPVHACQRLTCETEIAGVAEG